jgi:hypothetical protein
MTNTSSEPTPSAPLRILAAIGVALVFVGGCFFLIETFQPERGLVGVGFLLVLPAAVTAFVCYVTDPLARRSFGFHMLIPLWLFLVITIAALVVAAEGVICLVILSPIWFGIGCASAALTYRLRRRRGTPGQLHASVLLLLPLLAMSVEPVIPLPQEMRVVTRSIDIDAPPERIWPLALGVPDVQPGEGRWNLAQDLIGVPRPLGARMEGEGVGATRLARWEREIAFSERITEWQLHRRIGWRFEFDHTEGWDFTDRHLRPDSAYMRITTGGYTLEPLGPDRTRLVLETHYWMRTPVNTYSAWWGEFFLGDIENNVLALIKQRAESVLRAD